jgi:hypothetical protein
MRKNPGQPRPIAVQRLARDLERLAPRLVPARLDADPVDARARGHIGRICDTLTAAGVDPSRWTARDLITLIDADTRRRGWIAPARIDRPAAYLRYRLARLDLGGPSPSEVAARAAARTRADAAARAAERAATPPASADVRAAAMAAIRAVTRRPTTARRAR